MKRLCVFYKQASQWIGNKKVEWIICKGCQKKLRNGVRLRIHLGGGFRDHSERCLQCGGDCMCYSWCPNRE